MVVMVENWPLRFLDLGDGADVGQAGKLADGIVR